MRGASHRIQPSRGRRRDLGRRAEIADYQGQREFRVLSQSGFSPQSIISSMQFANFANGLKQLSHPQLERRIDRLRSS